MPRHLEAAHDVADGAEPGEAPAPAPASPRAAAAPAGAPMQKVQRVQTGVRMEKRLVKVLKALAELYDRSLGDLLEGIVLHAFAGRPPFSSDSLRRIAELERIYGLDLAARGALPPLEAAERRGAEGATSRPEVPYP